MVACSGGSGRAQLVHLNELLGGVIELDEKTEKERHYLNVSHPVFSSLPLSPGPSSHLENDVFTGFDLSYVASTMSLYREVGMPAMGFLAKVSRCHPKVQKAGRAFEGCYADP